MSRSIFFVYTAIGILIWNVAHLIHTLLPSDEEDIARIVWLIILIGGFVFIISSITGFSLLRNEELDWRLIIYAAIFSALLTAFFSNPEWMEIEYTENEGWIINPTNGLFWFIFAIVIAVIAFNEMQLPLIQALIKNPEVSKKPIITLLSGITIALVSNVLIPIFLEFNIPLALSYLIASVGFILFFYVLDQNPFVGIYDSSKLHEIIVTNEYEEAIFTLTTDEGKAILASGAILGINTVLERINLLTENIPPFWEDDFRRIELGFARYFIALQRGYVIIINYSNATGVCIQKFKALSRIFLNKNISPELLKSQLINRLELYFPTLKINKEISE
jgi:hypothetical protein